MTVRGVRQPEQASQHKMIVRIIQNKIKKEIVFVIATILAMITVFTGGFHYEAIDWHVILSLFLMMILGLAFEEYHVLDAIALGLMNRFHSERALSAVLIFITTLMGALVTNDVALLTIVPLTLAMSRKTGINPFRIVVLETAAANIGSSFSPFGSPQNLYLYSRYEYTPLGFLLETAPFVLFGMLLLYLLNRKNSLHPIVCDIKVPPFQHKTHILVYALLFVTVLAGILHFLPLLFILPVVLLFILLWDYKLLLKVDYFLPGTFVSFFLLIDNLTRWTLMQEAVASLLTTPLTVLAAGAVLSQGISNVPAAILLSGFTDKSKALLLGVNIGGLGTMIASLANLISYKLYVRDYPKKMYLRTFHLYNLLLFVALFAFCALLLYARQMFSSP